MSGKPPGKFVQHKLYYLHKKPNRQQLGQFVYLKTLSFPSQDILIEKYYVSATVELLK